MKLDLSPFSLVSLPHITISYCFTFVATIFVFQVISDILEVLKLNEERLYLESEEN